MPVRSVPIAAIDAGSNAVRVMVARAYPGGRLRTIRRERYAVRLGHNVFLTRMLDDEMIHKAIVAFRDIREILDHYHVKNYRAVATSATREAKNRARFIKQIRNQAEIDLEVIDGDEEARLTREAVLHQFGKRRPPGVIMDLGGGSLELNFLRRGKLTSNVTLPVGTVRLMERENIDGAISNVKAGRIRRYVSEMLNENYDESPDFEGNVVGSGGNAEALAKLAPGKPLGHIETIDLKQLGKVSSQLLALTVAERMRAYNVRRDRAEVLPIAAIVFMTMGEWLDVDRIVVPGVGVREGILCDFSRRLHKPSLRRKVSR